MNDISKSKPNAEQIESMLKRIRPIPGKEFYLRMETAPWKQASIGRKSRWTWLGNMDLNARLAAASLAVLLLAIASLIFMPSVRATAQNLLRFLMPAPEDAITIPVMIPYPDDSNVFDTPAAFDHSLEEAQRQVEYPLKDITLLMDGLRFNGAHYDPQLQKVTLRYTSGEFNLFFSQRPLGTIEEYSKIGASAPVEMVKVRGVDGEYVRGGWKILSPGYQVLETAPPGEQVFVEATWDATLPQNMLRWSEGGFLYELITTGNPEIDRSDILDIAKRVK